MVVALRLAKRGGDVIVALTGAKNISNLSPANRRQLIYRAAPLPTSPACGGQDTAMRAQHGKVAIVLARRICLKGAVTIVDRQHG